MSFRVMLSVAGLVFTSSPTPGQAEVLSINSTFAINGAAAGDPPVGAGDIDIAAAIPRGDFDVQSAPISRDALDLDRGTLAVTTGPEPPNWATSLLGLIGLGR